MVYISSLLPTTLGTMPGSKQTLMTLPIEILIEILARLDLPSMILCEQACFVSSLHQYYDAHLLTPAFRSLNFAFTT